MARDSRAGMVRSAAGLIGAHGVSATSFSDVLADSGAPRGSIYHHFPAGKEQLTEEAVRWTAERVLAHQRTCPATSPAEVLDWFVDMWRQVVLASGGAAGCVVAGVAVDTDAAADAVMSVVRSAFRSWVGLLVEQFQAAGVAADRAEALAVATLAGMEGALILCRAERDVAPLDAVAGQLARLLAD
jgi:TetR/AcrR family transcriptional regulator, lmrAB and yxaGH operons repressor